MAVIHAHFRGRSGQIALGEIDQELIEYFRLAYRYTQADHGSNQQSEPEQPLGKDVPRQGHFHTESGVAARERSRHT